MRVTRWELRDFGSHRHTVLEPGSARLVILTGENGVGKTTLASEALGHALYKDDRGSVNAGVRNGASESAVSIDFDFAGRRYRAVRRRTLRAGGKSSADLQAQGADGAWSPVASGDKEVPAAVRELLRMDAATFRTSVSLAQKDLDRFVAATAAGRHQILASIVVDPRFGPAAKLASAEARDLEASTRADRDTLARLDDVIGELEPVVDVLARHRADALAVADAAGLCASARDAAGDRLRDLDARLAAGEAQRALVERLEAQVADLANRYREARGRRETAAAAAERARAAIAAGEGADAAADALPTALEALADHEARLSQVNALDLEARARREAHAVASADHRAEVASWTAAYQAARSRVDELAGAAQALKPVSCPKCGAQVYPDGGDLTRRLADARAAFAGLEASKPKEPVGLAMEAGQIARLEERRAAIGHDPDALRAAAAEVRRLEQLAARADAVRDARASLAEAEAAIAAASSEMAVVTREGQAAAQAAAEARLAVDALEPVRAERDATAGEIARIRVELAGLEDRAREVGRLAARAEADVARLAEVREQRSALAAALAAADQELARLRKLAAAYGLKGIPARVIESVLPELGRHANDVLGQLFGMSLEIRASRATADGKGVVDEIDLVVRKDGTGELELERISGGQQTAVSLALAIALSRLNARRAGTAIRTLVVDEPEGLDTRRLRALGQALRTLAYEGELELVVVITHTAELAEYGDLVVDLRDGPDGVEAFIDGVRIEPDEVTAAAAA